MKWLFNLSLKINNKNFYKREAYKVTKEDYKLLQLNVFSHKIYLFNTSTTGGLIL